MTWSAPAALASLIAASRLLPTITATSLPPCWFASSRPGFRSSMPTFLAEPSSLFHEYPKVLGFCFHILTPPLNHMRFAQRRKQLHSGLFAGLFLDNDAGFLARRHKGLLDARRGALEAARVRSISGISAVVSTSIFALRAAILRLIVGKRGSKEGLVKVIRQGVLTPMR